MHGRRLARGLVLITGALAGLLAITQYAGARSLSDDELSAIRGNARSAGATTGTGGAHTSAGIAAQTGPPVRGGAPPTGSSAGHASGTNASSAPQSTVVVGPGRSTAVVPPSPRQRPIGIQAVTPAVLTPASHDPLSSLDSVFQGTNNSTNATAVSGPATAVNSAVVTGPTGTVTGDITTEITQNTTVTSGNAYAGSQVFGSASTLSSTLSTASHDPDDLFFSLGHASTFFDVDDHDLFFAHDHFFFDDDDVDDALRDLRREIRRFERRLERFERLVDRVEDCLDRLADHWSRALANICENRIERLADEGGFGFFGFGFVDGFFSVGGTHALFGGDAIAISGNGTHALIGSHGVMIAGDGEAVSLSPFGVAASFPGGAATADTFWLIGPFGFTLAGINSTTWWSPWTFSRLHHRLGLASLRLRLALARSHLGFLEHHRHLILGTIHSHSLLDLPALEISAPFGHRTVFVTDRFFSRVFFHDLDTDEIEDAVEDVHEALEDLRDADSIDEIEEALEDLEEALHDLREATSHATLVFHRFSWWHRWCWSCFRFRSSDPILDLPGIEIGGGLRFV